MIWPFNRPSIDVTAPLPRFEPQVIDRVPLYACRDEADAEIAGRIIREQRLSALTGHPSSVPFSTLYRVYVRGEYQTTTHNQKEAHTYILKLTGQIPPTFEVR